MKTVFSSNALLTTGRRLLTSRRVVFNIKGNDFRLVVAVAYRFGAVYIKFVGTHKQYDGIDADTIEME
ncbi:mRNA-degrading endonuclease HigB of HigAB toxin-antitoxin module [Pseudomonas sp. ADAK2 TE3594]|jgi:mRNA interferase HigB